MKFKPIILACAVGCSFAFVLFSKIEECSLKEPDGNAVAIQIGVFTEKKNAEKMSDNYGGIIVEDGDVYRVYYSIIQRDKNIDFIENCLDEKGVSYYLKKLNFEEESLEKSSALEELIMSTENKIKVTEEILKMYEEVL